VESAGKDSRLAQEHPEWFLHRYGEQVPRLLDLTIPQVRKYVEDTVCSLIDRYQLDLFRLDYNTDQLEGGFNNKDGQWENTLYRHVEAMWEIFGSLRKKYPNLQLENCSSGGGRTDLGMVRHFTTTWVSDWFKMPRTVRIFNGMTLVLPPEYVDRMFGVCMEGCFEGNFETQLQLAAMSHMTLIGVTPHLAQANPKAMDTVRKYVQIYKEFIRPMHGEMNVYHHTPVLDGLDGNGWCVLEYAHEDRSKGVTCVFRQSRAPGESYRLRMKGLDRGASYRVRMEPEGQIWKTTGERLMEEGLEVRLDTALSSKMFLAEKIEE